MRFQGLGIDVIMAFVSLPLYQDVMVITSKGSAPARFWWCDILTAAGSGKFLLRASALMQGCRLRSTENQKGLSRRIRDCLGLQVWAFFIGLFCVVWYVVF